MKRIVFLFFVLGFLSAAVFAGFVGPVGATGTIYVRLDGSVDPATAPIQRIGDIYTFTENIYAEIVVERDNIVVDGAGYTLQGSGSGTGIDISERTNVTIGNMEIREFLYGVYIYSSLNNSLSGNVVTNNNYGIRIRYSTRNNVSGNNVRNSFYGIWLTGSSNNTINENNITANNNDGIWLSGSSDHNNLCGNNIKNNRHGIRIDDYSNNMFRNNDVSDNEYNFGVYGSLLPEFIQDIDDSNTVNGKPIYYWVNKRDMAVPLDAGWAVLVNCTRITVKNLDLANNGQGVLLAYTTNSTIAKNNITKNIHSIYLSGSSNNTVNENNITENAGNGIYLYYSPINTFSHNNFINNTNQVYNVGGSINVWDDGVEGNYWSDYEDRYPDATEMDGSGIWDTPYVIDGNNQDNYPRMNPVVFPEVPDTTPPTISIVSPENKTYAVNHVSLTLTVSEPTSWIGYSLDGQTNITIAENTTLTGLSDGMHNLAVYAKDTAGNTGTSETIYFTVAQQSELFLTWIVVAIVIMAVVGAALLVYFVKVKKTTGKAEK